MSRIADRLRLIKALNGIRLLPVSVVGHSIGSTLNIGFGATTPRRYARRKTGWRRPGYSRIAECDLFLASAAWEFRGASGYRLRSWDNPRRIAREIEASVGKSVVSGSLHGFRHHAEIRFAGGITLRFTPHPSDDAGGWNFKFGRNYIPASGPYS